MIDTNEAIELISGAEQNAREITMNEFYWLIDETFALLNQVADKIGFHGNKRVTRGARLNRPYKVCCILYSPSDKSSHYTS